MPFDLILLIVPAVIVWGGIGYLLWRYRLRHIRWETLDKKRLLTFVIGCVFGLVVSLVARSDIGSTPFNIVFFGFVAVLLRKFYLWAFRKRPPSEPPAPLGQRIEDVIASADTLNERGITRDR